MIAVALVSIGMAAMIILDPVEVFQSVCVDGEAQFTPSSIAQIKRTALPSVLLSAIDDGPLLPDASIRVRKAVPVTGRYYQVHEAGRRGFLVIEDHASGQLGMRRTCSYATESLDMRSAVQRFDPKEDVSGLAENRKVGNFSTKAVAWTRFSSLGYSLKFTGIGQRWTLMQSFSGGENGIGAAIQQRDNLLRNGVSK